MKKPKFLGKITLRQTLVILAIVGAVGGGLYYVFKVGTEDSAAGPGGKGGRNGFGGSRTQPVSASPVKVRDVPIWINAIGTMVPKNLVTVHSRVDGELLKLNFAEGQVVKAGQLLAEIDPRAFQVQLTQANGQMARDQAQLKNAQVDLERYRTLLAQDSISKQQVDTQESLVRQYQGTVEVDKGVVAAAQLQLSYTKVTAPVAGRVGLRQVDPGNIVKAGDTNGIVIIAQVQPITAVFSVPEVNLPTVTAALASKDPTPVEVWDRELKNKLAAGRLLTADNQIDTTTGTLKLKAEFKNEDNTLFPNQFVNVRLFAGTAANAKVVPGSAVLRGAKGSFVYVIKEDKVSAVPVKTGTTQGDKIVIEGDVAEGAMVVTDGADKLRDGAQVEVISEEARNKATSAGKPRNGKGRRGEEGSSKGSGEGKPAEASQSSPAAAPGNAEGGGERRKRDGAESKDGAAPAQGGKRPADAATADRPGGDRPQLSDEERAERRKRWQETHPGEEPPWKKREGNTAPSN
ncbi:MAG TPA: MdtA/MuxA family multidrug efflux RND transporter periplasmic adaptor subunit [Rhodocyclaceae bacterium]|nr:MdtA/MuxA family multidrug efflux RND transporter periplasmic adaptor subunit [Rhodocyclaceae bacterium]